MGYKTMCLVTAAGDWGGSIFIFPAAGVCEAHVKLLVNFKGNYPSKYGLQVKGGVSGRQAVHTGIWAEPQVQSACEVHVKVHTFASEYQAGLDCKLEA